MKLRIILPNDKPDTIEAQKQLVIAANAECTIEGININPLKKNEQREGEFEVDFILKHTDEKFIENQIKKGLENTDGVIKQLEKDVAQLKKEKDELALSNKELEKELRELQANG